MSDDRIAVVDVETTGLSPWRHDRVVEIAIVVMSPDGRIEQEYDTLVNPQRDLGPTHIHRITAAEVMRAPTFPEIAGDVLDVLRGTVAIAGHNVSFDRNFLVKEYERSGVALEDFPVICTCQLFGRGSLVACCEELAVSIDGDPHRALTDARATARLLAHLFGEDPTLISRHRIPTSVWPAVPTRKTPCVCRELAATRQREPSRFLERLAKRVHHDVDAAIPNVLAYLALLDRVLEDRVIDQQEECLLIQAADNWQLTSPQIRAAHAQYLQNLSVVALADGIITDAERSELHLVAQLLGQDCSQLDAMLVMATNQLAAARPVVPTAPAAEGLKGQRVCFTGELQATLNGQSISRELAETLAAQAGLIVTSGVTKKLDLLVVADPMTQSGKAKKAREYGVRILADSVFWRLAGVNVD
jgi:DNA polymerase-3 subunit epsilon